MCLRLSMAWLVLQCKSAVSIKTVLMCAACWPKSARHVEADRYGSGCGPCRGHVDHWRLLRRAVKGLALQGRDGRPGRWRATPAASDYTAIYKPTSYPLQRQGRHNF